MNKFWERVFYIFAYITQGASYLSPRAYAVMHRMHHAYTDTDKDPHSPQNSSNAFMMMLATQKIYSDIYRRRIQPEKQFLKNIPQWDVLDRIGESYYSRGAWILLYILFFVLFADSAWLYLLLPFVILMGPVHGVIINWFAHKYGFVNFKLNNTSRNLFLVDIFMMGEGYHNDHHHSPSNANFGARWFEIDPVYIIILGLDKLRIIRLAKQ